MLDTNCHIKLNVYEGASYTNIMPSPYTAWGQRTISNMSGYEDTMSSFQWQWRQECT